MHDRWHKLGDWLAKHARRAEETAEQAKRLVEEGDVFLAENAAEIERIKKEQAK